MAHVEGCAHFPTITKEAWKRMKASAFTLLSFVDAMPQVRKVHGCWP